MGWLIGSVIFLAPAVMFVLNRNYMWEVEISEHRTKVRTLRRVCLLPRPDEVLYRTTGESQMLILVAGGEFFFLFGTLPYIIEEHFPAFLHEAGIPFSRTDSAPVPLDQIRGLDWRKISRR